MKQNDQQSVAKFSEPFIIKEMLMTSLHYLRLNQKQKSQKITPFLLNPKFNRPKKSTIITKIGK